MDTAEFLTELYGRVASGYVEIRCLHREGGMPERLWRPLPLGNVKSMTRIEHMNADGWNIYHRIGISHRKKATKEYITALPALWVDVDDNSPESLAAIHDMYWPPSITVSSGRGFHAYWTFDEPLIVTDENFEIIERTLQGMAFMCGGDPKVKDISRILRTPGTYNVKPEYGDNPPYCEVIDFMPCWFEFDWLCKVYEPLAPVDAIPTVTRDISAFIGRQMPRWVDDYLRIGAGKGERNQRAYVAARALFDNGYDYGETEQLIFARAAADGLKTGEIKATIKSAYHAPRGVPSIPSHLKSFMAVEDGVIGEAP